MEKVVRGNKYNFYIISKREKFLIKATCKLSGKYSCINNLNIILSELNIPQNNFRYHDSMWNINKSKYFYRKIVDSFSNRSFVDYIEKKLDEDRFYGEWENKI